MTATITIRLEYVRQYRKDSLYRYRYTNTSKPHNNFAGDTTTGEIPKLSERLAQDIKDANGDIAIKLELGKLF